VSMKSPLHPVIVVVGLLQMYLPKAGPNTMRWDDTSDSNIKSRMILHGLPLKAIEVLSCMSFLPLQEF
jgi:hypothetical protein